MSRNNYITFAMFSYKTLKIREENSLLFLAPEIKCTLKTN